MDSAAKIIDIEEVREQIEAQEQRRKEAQIQYEKQKNGIPEKHLIPNGTVANDMTSRTRNKGNRGKRLPVDAGEILKKAAEGKKKGEKIESYYIMDYDNENALSALPLTEYDRAVADTVTSLYDSGITVATTATIYRAMVHDTNSEKPSPKNLEAVKRSLEKMEGIKVSINFREQIINRDLPLTSKERSDGDNGINEGRIRGRLLAMDETWIKAGGKTVDAYCFLRRPIMYEYSAYIGQVISVSSEVLEIRDKNGDKVTNNERRIAVRSYLLRRICIMKGKSGKSVSRRILYETIFEEACRKDTDGNEAIVEVDEKGNVVKAPGDKGLTKRERELVREYVIQVLEHWKSISFIKDYKVVERGKEKRGVEIIV